MYFCRVSKNYTMAHLGFNDPFAAAVVQYYVRAYPSWSVPSPAIANYEKTYQPLSAHWFPSPAVETRHLCVLKFPLTSSPSGEHLKRTYWQIAQLTEVALALLTNRKLASQLENCSLSSLMQQGFSGYTLVLEYFFQANGKKSCL